MLEVINFSKKYKNNTKYSARHVSFSVAAGEVVGLVGSNGAGKSTIIKSIIGVLPFTDGTIKVGGYDIVKQPEKAKKLIGYVPDDHSVYEKLTGREYINYMGSLYGATVLQKKFATDELAKRFDIAHALDAQIAGYSHGMRQKICILGALVHCPKLWILDEPMVGLDHQTMMLLCQYIRGYANAKHAVLFSTHNLEVVRKTCDKVVFIREGRIANIVDLRTAKGFDIDSYYMQLNGKTDAAQTRPAGQNAPYAAPSPIPMSATPMPAPFFPYPYGVYPQYPVNAPYGQAGEQKPSPKNPSEVDPHA